jgi:hypothetical protein
LRQEIATLKVKGKQMTKEPNPEKYEQMAAPFAGTESAIAALEGFRADLFELREKHRIKEVVFVAEVAYEAADQNSIIRVVGNAGSSFRVMDLLLYAADKTNEENLGIYKAITKRLKASEKDDAA